MIDQGLMRAGRIDFAAVALMAFAAGCFMLVSPHPLVDGDTGWHIAAGQWILDHRSIPKVDPFSYTYLGRPWVAHEWLSEVLMALAYLGAGWSGVLALFSVATVALFLVLGLHLRRWLRPASLLATLGLTWAVMVPYLVDRPHLLALPILAVWTTALIRARESGRAPPLALCAVMTVWANLHGSFLFGLALVVPFACEAALEARGARLDAILRWAGFGVLAFSASLLTPHGVTGLLFPLSVTSMKVLPQIGEWVSAKFDKPSAFELVFLYAVLICLVRGVRVPALRALILLGALYMALQHIRQQAVLAVLAPLILAEPLGRAFEPAAARPRPSLRESLTLGWREHVPAAIVLCVLAAGALVFRLALPMQRPDSENAPVTAISHVPDTLRTEPVFNDYSFGGLLIFNGMRPYIDGRADMFGDRFTLDAVEMLRGDKTRWEAAVNRYGIRWTILAPNKPLVALLDQDPRWRRVYADKWAVVHEAVQPGRQPVSAQP